MTLLSLLILLPILSSILVLLAPERSLNFYRYLSLGNALATLGIVIYLIFFQPFLIEKHPWFELNLRPDLRLQVEYFLGADGLSLSLLLLSGIVFLIAAISSWNLNHRPKAYYTFIFLLMGSVLGCFLALDFFLFFLFFEFMLLPMYFLIGIWGGERREFAALKFILYTLVGSVFILLVMLVVGYQAGSLNIPELRGIEAVLDTSGITLGGLSLSKLLFFGLLIGFGIKLPAVPLHTWLPDAHVEAPTPISVILAGILLKIGAYGLLRIGFTLFPLTAYDHRLLIGGLGLLSIPYGGLNALAQKDLKKLIAYSSVSHMGFVLLGFASFNSSGMNGAVFQLFSHGLLSSMLFLIAGVLYDRTHNRLIENYRGLAAHMPYFTGAVVIAFFGSMGLPGLSGFIGEFFSLMGVFQALPIWMAALGTLGILLAAGYLLWTLQRMFFGSLWINKFQKEDLPDLSFREKLMLYSLALLVIAYGVAPALLLKIISPALQLYTPNP